MQVAAEHASKLQKILSSAAPVAVVPSATSAPAAPAAAPADIPAGIADDMGPYSTAAEDPAYCLSSAARVQVVCYNDKKWAYKPNGIRHDLAVISKLGKGGEASVYGAQVAVAPSGSGYVGRKETAAAADGGGGGAAAVLSESAATALAQSAAEGAATATTIAAPPVPATAAAKGGDGHGAQDQATAAAAAAVAYAGVSSSTAASTPTLPEMVALKVAHSYSYYKQKALQAKAKVLSPEQYKQNVMDSFREQYTIMTKCAASQHVVKCYGWGTVGGRDGEEHPCLLLELSRMGSVGSKLAKVWGVGLKLSEVWRHVRDAAKGLHDLHKYARAMHRDLKASNLLLVADEKWGVRAKLADFGISKILEGLDDQVDTLRWSYAQRAPESRPGMYQYASIDTYHLGCLLLELKAGRNPFWYIDQDPILTEAEKRSRRCSSELSRADCPYRALLTPLELQMAASCLQYHPSRRPSMTTLLWMGHPYFTAGPPADEDSVQ